MRAKKTTILMSIGGALALASGLLADLPREAKLIRVASSPDRMPPHQGVKMAEYHKEGKTYKAVSTVYFLSPRVFRFEGLEPENYKGQITLADGEQFRMVLPTMGIRVDVPLAEEEMPVETGEQAVQLSVRYPLLLENYDVRVTQGQPVAGRPTWKLDLQHKQAALQRIAWIDQETYLPLKEQRAMNGEIYFVTQYTEISFEAPSREKISELPKTRTLPVPPAQMTTYLNESDLKAKALGFPHLDKLPYGFTFDFGSHFKSVGGERKTVAYTDGVRFLRLTILDTGFMGGLAEKLMGEKAKEGRREAGRFVPYPIHEVDLQGKQLMVSGEFSVEELAAFAKRAYIR